MKKLIANKSLKYLACLMIVTQGILVALVAIFHLNANYIDNIRYYPHKSIAVKLRSIPEKSLKNTLSYMIDFSINKGIFIVKQDLLRSDDSTDGMVLGIAGDYEKNKNYLKLDFLGQNIIDYEKIKMLANSNEEDMVLGIERSSLKSLREIPYFKFGDNIVVKNLSSLVNESKTLNGEYRIIGIEQKDLDGFLDGISKVSGVSKEVLVDGKSGYIIDRGFMRDMLWLVLLAHSIVLLSLFMVITSKSLPLLGRFMMLGWSKIAFATKLYSTYLLLGFLSIFLFVLYGIYFTDGTFSSITFFSAMVVFGVINFLLLVILMGISSTLIFLVKPINAIRDRFPMRIYIIASFVVYLVFNMAMVGTCIYIDGPYKQIKQYTEISNKWKEVSDYHILSSVSVGKDQSSFNYQSKQYHQDLFNWYSSFAQDKGAYIIKTSYYSDEILAGYRLNQLFKSIPDKPLWLFAISPNYLRKIGLEISQDVVDKSLRGVRTYLIPESCSEKNKVVLENWLMENDTKSLKEDDIETVFNKEKKFNFVRYKDDKPLFNWSVDIEKPITTKSPVIMLTTPKSMQYFETESLGAIGLTNSWIKLDKEASAEYLSKDYLRRYNLEDNRLVFKPIKEYVDGVQKTLWKTIQFFYMLIVAVSLIVLSMLFTTIAVFQLTYKEIISVKKFLGYGIFNIYKTPILLVSIVMITDLAIVTYMYSKIGIVYVILINLIQIGLFYRIIAKNELKKLNEFIKA